jgi:hypothetical protein
LVNARFWPLNSLVLSVNVCPARFTPWAIPSDRMALAKLVVAEKIAFSSERSKRDRSKSAKLTPEKSIFPTMSEGSNVIPVRVASWQSGGGVLSTGSGARVGSTPSAMNCGRR